MTHDSGSGNVRRLWHGSPQASTGASILQSFTLLMNLHIFVAEPVNPVHIFHEAHTVPFCLTADHIATCLCLSSAFQASKVFGLLFTRGVWQVSALIRDNGLAGDSVDEKCIHPKRHFSQIFVFLRTKRASPDWSE